MNALSFFNQFAGLAIKYGFIAFAITAFLFIIYLKIFSKQKFRVNWRIFIFKSYLTDYLGLKESLILVTFVNIFRFIFAVLGITLIMFVLSVLFLK